ncbi:MAG: hypothetical protein ACK4PK_09660 [Alphaproteobacteria bacterium]
MTALFPNMPEWLSYLIGGLTIFVMMASACVIATRAGRNPYWGALVILPFFAPVLIWVLAYCRWPSFDKTAEPLVDNTAEPSFDKTIPPETPPTT